MAMDIVDQTNAFECVGILTLRGYQLTLPIDHSHVVNGDISFIAPTSRRSDNVLRF